MSIENKVFEILSTKVELASNKIELGLIDDIGAMRAQLSQLNSEIKSSGDREYIEHQIVQNAGEKALQLLKQADNAIQKITSMYKELGLGDASQDKNVKALLLQMNLVITNRKEYHF